MKCEKCGRDVPEQIDYCPNCKLNENRNQNNHEKTTSESNYELEEQIKTEEKMNERATRKKERIQREEKIYQIFKKYENRAFTSMIIAFIPFTILTFSIFSFSKYTDLSNKVHSMYPLITNITAFIIGMIGLHSKRRVLIIFGLLLGVIAFCLFYWL